MLKIRYTDIEHGERSIKPDSQGFVLTNEEPEPIRYLTEIAKPTNVLAIVGGGVTMLLGVLPFVREVTGIDVSYRSIAATAVKVGLIDRNYPYIQRVLDCGEKYFEDFVNKELIEYVPENVRNKGHSSFREIFDPETRADWYYPRFERMWSQTSPEILERIRKNLPGLSLVHGDARNVKGRFDMIYASNTCDDKWTGYLPFTPYRFLSMIKHRGFLLSSAEIHAAKRLGAREVAKTTSRKEGATPWDYTLYRRMF